MWARSLHIGADDPDDVPELAKLLDMFAGIDDVRLPKSKQNLDMVDKSEGVEEEEMEAWDDVKGRPLNPKLV